MAVAEVAQMLKAKFVEEKRDRFAEASKVVRQPDLLQPSTLSFQSCLTLAQPAYEADLKEAEKAHGHLDFVEMMVNARGRRNFPPSWLVLRSKPFKILHLVGGGMVWRCGGS